MWYRIQTIQVYLHILKSDVFPRFRMSGSSKYSQTWPMIFYPVKTWPMIFYPANIRTNYFAEESRDLALLCDFPQPIYKSGHILSIRSKRVKRFVAFHKIIFLRFASGRNNPIAEFPIVVIRLPLPLAVTVVSFCLPNGNIPDLHTYFGGESWN